MQIIKRAFRTLSQITVDSDLDMGAHSLKTDIVAESTEAAGVAVDGVENKDGNVDGKDVSTLIAALSELPIDADLNMGAHSIKVGTVEESVLHAGVTVDGRWVKDGRASTPLTVAQFQGVVATGDATNPLLINNGETVETGVSFTLNQYVELVFDEFKAITQFRIYPYHIQHNGVGRFAIQYWNGAAWVNWKTGIPTSNTDAWVNWETVSTIVTKKLRIVCTTQDTGDTFSRCIELEVKY